MKGSTRVQYLVSKQGYNHIVVSPEFDTLTYVFTIDYMNQTFIYYGLPNKDIFSSHTLAIKTVSEVFKSEFLETGVGFLGGFIYNNCIIIGIITEKYPIAFIPPKSIVYEIKSIKYHCIKNNGEECKLPSFVEDFPIYKLHYYCESFDITRPFPSNRPVSDFNPDFCWNLRCRSAFSAVPQACVVLLQGFCSSMFLSNNPTNVIYFVRRSSANPGTRYNSRGLDENGNPGNEVECDLCFIRENAFYVNTWSRGSVPIKWKTVAGILGVQHQVEEVCNPQTHKYFSKVSQNIGSIPVIVVSLLDDNEKHLQDSYKLSIESIDSPKIDFYEYDLNKMMKKFQDKELVENLSRFLYNIDLNTGFRTFQTQQHAIIRFNCVDSLDRTNIATFAHAKNLAQMMNASDDEMAFIARSFIIAGDNISQMYTGTPAIKKSAIISYLNNNSSDTFDTPTSVLRFFVNFFGSAQSIIEDWTAQNIPQKFVSTIIDPLHLSIVPTVSDAINSKKNLNWAHLGEMIDIETYSLEETTNSLIISLPAPTQFSSILLLLTPPIEDFNPPTGFSVSTGNDLDNMHIWMNGIPLPRVNSPTWVKFDMNECNLWNASIPYEKAAADFCRFVKIDFDVGIKFCLGNIKVVCMDDDEYCITHTCDNFHKTHPRVMKSYIGMMKEIEKKGNQADITDILNLEIQRLTAKIPLHVRNMEIIKTCLNPIIYEPLKYFNCNGTLCSLCRRQNYCNTPGIIYSSPVYPSLINLHFEESSDGGDSKPFIVCSECLKKLNQKKNELMNLHTNIYNDLKPKKIEDVKPDKWYEMPMKEDIYELTKAPAFLVECPEGQNDPNHLLSGFNDFLWTSKNEDTQFSFNICLRGYAMAKRVSFVFSGEIIPKSVLISGKEYPIMNAMDEIALETKCEFLILTFLMPSESCLSIRSIAAYGCYELPPMMKAQNYKFQPLAFKASRRYSITDTDNRYVKFPLSQVGRLRFISFELSPPDSSYHMKSAYVATYMKGVYVDGVHIILPTVISSENETSSEYAGYPLNFTKDCDCIIVFFLDRHWNVNMPNIMLNIGPPSQ